MKRLYTSLLLAAVAFGAAAQTPRNGYFSENMPLRHELNPSFAPDYNYVTVPALGGITAGANANIGADNFLFKKNGEVVTGLHSSVGADEFLDGLKSRNYLEVNANLNLVSVGFKALGGFNTVGLNLKSTVSTSLPYELFEFAKIGQVNGGPTTYDIKDTRVISSNYVELAFGHSRNLGDKIRVGAKVKYIAGVAYADARIDAINVAMSADKWSVREQGRMFSSDALDIQYKPNGEIDDIDTGTFGVAGNGLGFDFGVSYNLWDNLKLSASLTDVGFISWKGSEATVNPDEFVYDGFHHLVADKDPDGSSALSREGDQLEEDLKKLVRFQNETDASRVQSLQTMLNLAGEYSILNNKIGFGLLWSTRLGTPKKWTEVMASANFRPSSWFNATVNFSTSNLGHSLGALVNFCPRGFNFFIGTDYLPFKYSKEGVPLSKAKFNFVLGMAITFNHHR